MHILATFATLCCQTRWPRNHSCTTQEHVSFFRTFSDIFGNFDFLTLFAKNAQICKFRQKREKTQIHKCAHFCKTCSQTRTSPKTFRACSQLSANVQMCKCANVRICEFVFFHVFVGICNLSVFCKKCQKVEISENVRKCPKKAHVFLSGTRVVPGPTRLTTQGGKSRQNMH